MTDSVLSVKPPVEIEMTDFAAKGVNKRGKMTGRGTLKGKGILPSRAQLTKIAKGIGATAAAVGAALLLKHGLQNKDFYSATFQRQMDRFLEDVENIPEKVKRAVGLSAPARPAAKTDKVYSSVLEPGEDDF